ncbi:LytTR family DNA-binding domain-containing protein [Chitinophaga sancti]|uniref:LytR/AlgR family response regulator transcription factor n=1 Tax=Chitinophaga sancti TaxID=1004 RepID=UPI002A761517|nr:LytTR family DNA-binding domain-containing protein [Chitinophaga sancti]WPQ60487.1 LytTR family DNA-binding domain-containing protein [Chitinophaga sancti]
MRPLDAITIDDEPIAHEILSLFSKKLNGIRLKRQFTNPEQAYQYLASNHVDLILLDIEMADVNGFSFYRSLPQRPMVIFTTAHPEYALEGFNVAAVDYLLKPFSEERFEQAILKAGMQKDLQEMAHSLTIRADYETRNVQLKDILYIEGLNNYVKIYTTSATHPLLSMMSLKEMMSRLPGHQFMRIHRSYIVPRPRVSAITSRYVTVAGKKLPVGDTYRSSVMTILQ